MSVFPSTPWKSVVSTVVTANWPALISGFSSFPHLCDLQILEVQWSKDDVRDIVASLPNLRFLTLEGWRAWESSSTQGAEDWPPGRSDHLPHLEALRLLFDDGESALLDIFDGSGYPANVQGLEMLTIYGNESEDNHTVSCDDVVIQRIHTLDICFPRKFQNRNALNP
ncbi:hypothetical protein EDD85DRAFT_130173 [Armillaria nabsnona]|nr:hypothetical protein EDD85DRAFT_130173 [Armillaria nabsnona]